MNNIKKLAVISATAVALAFPAICLAAAPWEAAADNTLAVAMSIARVVAIIACFACGAAAIFGKLAWDWAGKIIIGMIFMFGGSYFVDSFTGATNTYDGGSYVTPAG